MNNGAAIGYMLLAATALELDPEVIYDLIALMREKMDFYDEIHAEKYYQNF